MITGDENLMQIAEMGTELIPVFEKQGLGSYFKQENLQKIGRFMRLETLLKAKNIDVNQFIGLLNGVLNATKTEAIPELAEIQENLHFAAMLPCGLRNPFKEYFESIIQENQQKYKDLNYLIEGNVNHELSYYPLLDSITDANELPDIIMASDVNNFYHRPFMERFIKNGVFTAYDSFIPNDYLEKVDYNDPNENFTMFTANMLVIVVDKKLLGDRPMPKTWDDIMNPMFENDIIMRGEDDFFCNAVLLPFYKDHGFSGVQKMARNIKSGMHPAEMVKLVGSGKEEGATIYIMPYFFSKRIKNKDVKVIWPEDGAIVSPVFLLVKTEKIEENKKLLELLFSKQTGDMMLRCYFPSTNQDIDHSNFPQAAKWLGWDFLYGNDIGKVKTDIRDSFMEVWETKN